MGKPKAPCGTDAAYRRHLRDGVEPDAACKEAHADLRRVSRRSPAASPARPVPPDSTKDKPKPPSEPPADDMTLIIDTLRTAFVAIATADPTKLAPIAREFRSVVEAVNGPGQPAKELSLAEQLAEARSARAARAQGQVTAS
jgi:hypothetical protein